MNAMGRSGVRSIGVPVLAVVVVVTAAACSTKEVAVEPVTTTLSPATSSTSAPPETTSPPATAARSAEAFCAVVEDHVDLLRDLSGVRSDAVAVFRQLDQAAPDREVGEALGQAADLIEANAEASQSDLEEAVAQARQDDPDFAAGIRRVPTYVLDECDVVISGSATSTSTTRPRSTTSTTEAVDEEPTTTTTTTTTVDSSELFAGGLRSFLAQGYGTESWYDDLDRFALTIVDDEGSTPFVRAAVGSTTVAFDETTAEEICAALIEYAASSELDRDVSVTGPDDRILVRSSSYRYQCTAP
jgi:hypothetical protein